MTREEAREWLLQIKDRIRGGDEEFDARRHEALDMAIEALNHSEKPNGSLISRQAAITLPVMPKEHREYQTFNLDDAYEQGWDDLQKCIETLPSADRPTGEWIMHIDDLYPEESTQECSNCHKHETIFIQHDNYCPNCGAKMVREDGEV